MAHFAFVAPPLRGHYRPLSNLAAELIARGHEATFIHQKEARPLVEAEGARFAAIGGAEPAVDSWTRPMTKIRGIIGLGGMMKRMERFTTMFCREAPRVLRELGVDAVINDQMEPGGAMAAEHLGLPWVSVADTLPMNREEGVPPPFVNWPYDASERGLRRNRGGWMVTDLLLRGFNRVIERNAQELGLPPKRRLEDCFSPTLQLSQMVPGLDFPRAGLPSTFHYTGPFRRGADEPFDLPPSDGRLTVFASLGTLQGSRVEMFRKVAEACDRLGLRLVLTHGRLAKPGTLDDLPGSPLVYSWVPQETVLRDVDLMVCHGGINTVLDPLMAGVPIVVMPLTFEQPAIAARIAYSGAGIMLGRRASVRQLSDAIRRIRDEGSYRGRAETLRDEMKASGGVRRAADLVEQAIGVSARRGDPTMEDAAQDDARGDSRNGSS